MALCCSVKLLSRWGGGEQANVTIQLDLSDDAQVPQASSPVPRVLCVYLGIILGK